MSNLGDGNGALVSLFEEEEETSYLPADDPLPSSHRSQAADLGLSAQLGRSLKLKSKEKVRENTLLRQQTESQHKLLLRLGQIVQKCEDPTYLTERIEADFLQGKVMSPEEAVSMTICSLQQQMESMADERDTFISKIIMLQCQVQELECQKEAHLCKIQALESLVQKGKNEKIVCVDAIKQRTDTEETSEETSTGSDSSF